MKKYLLLLSILSISFFLVQSSQAQSQQRLSSFDDIQNKTLTILSNIINFLFSFLMIISSIILIYLGIKYITSNKEVQSLHKSLLYIIVGIVFLVTSFVIPSLIRDFIEKNIQIQSESNIQIQ